MSFENLFSIMREALIKMDVSEVQIHVAFEFQVLGDPEGVFYVEIDGGQMRVEPYNYYDRDVSFAASADTYLAIVNGELNPMLAFAVGRVKVYGDMSKVQRIFSHKNYKKYLLK